MLLEDSASRLRPFLSRVEPLWTSYRHSFAEVKRSFEEEAAAAGGGVTAILTVLEEIGGNDSLGVFFARVCGVSPEHFGEFDI